MTTKRKRPHSPPPNDEREAAPGGAENGAVFTPSPEFIEWLGCMWPPHDFGPWPEGFTVSREQIYDEDGR